MTAKQDAQKLVDEFMPFAKQMLGKHQEFLPYGGRMAIGGEIVHVGATTGEEISESHPLIHILREAHREQAQAGVIRASCTVYDIRTVPPNRTEKQDAIAFEVDHRDDYSRVVIFPYAISDSGEIVTEAPFAVGGEAAIFSSEANNEKAEQAEAGYHIKR
ncbi:MAG: hypothetical protein ACSHYF_14740 [Verrucomicrobiaceae bacterium]